MQSALREAPPARSLSRRNTLHSVLAPLHYERKYAYPLLIWLHSPGADERELAKIMPLVSLRNYVSVGVRGPACESRGFGWPQTPDAIHEVESRLALAMAAAQDRFHIHPQRLFLAGYASAGTMALRIALRNPDRFAAAASLGGSFPDTQAPLARLGETRQTKFLIEHCRDSLAYPIDLVCRELYLFHAAGLSVTLRQYPCGDELTTQMLHDLDVWLMEQVTGTPQPEQEPASLPSDWN